MSKKEKYLTMDPKPDLCENAALVGIESIVKLESFYLITYKTSELARLYILNNHVFRYYMSPTGTFPEYPTPNNPEDKAKITVKTPKDYGFKEFNKSTLTSNDYNYEINTEKIQIDFDKSKGTMLVYDKRSSKEVLRETEPLSYANNAQTQSLNQNDDEYFYGGGMQNGRFSHKGELISIVNSNNWVDGGVSSPCPFYWSTYGYGVLRNTWQPGTYDFGVLNSTAVKTTHNSEEFDAFYFINSHPADILKDYYELTGHPIFLPEYAFYEAHLNAFNRDYWVRVSSHTPGAVLFEDGFYYKSHQPKEGKDGILESLNGENNNYQFSARAMIDRYKRHDIPLGWFIPNDGYGSGYGQTTTLDGDIENLREFADYARSHGVEVALWTESQLTPKNPKEPKKGERDLAKEVGVAGVVALKCDVAWIGSGYSFALNAIEDAAHIFMKNRARDHRNQRLLIITVDGWAGSQRYAGVWSGDQSGGYWEYIRFHIPTYIGSGLSGQPVVGSDMDGIYAGGDKEVNIRDYQWKTFTPLQLNMDGWGKVPKTPFAYDKEATDLNRAYLKLKSMLLPYNYTIGYQSTHDLPMVRAMFLEFPDDIFAHTADTQYQFMWGPYFLVAPVYNSDPARNGIYLPDPDQVWVDFLTGEKYQGGIVLNNFETPLWKIPIFVKDGAIIPMVNSNNNPEEIHKDIRVFTIYPNGLTNFTVYEDDGISSDYQKNEHAKTLISVYGPKINDTGDLAINIHKTEGNYINMVEERITLLQALASSNIKRIKAAVNGKTLHLSEAKTEEQFIDKENVYYFKEDYVTNPHLSNLRENKLYQKCLLIKIQKLSVKSSAIQIKIFGYTNSATLFGSHKLNKELEIPKNFTKVEHNITPSSITLQWDQIECDYYEIEKDGTIFSNIKENKHKFEGFKPNTSHTFRIRSVKSCCSDWSNAIVVKTYEDHVIKGVKVWCNTPCQPHQEVTNLTSINKQSWWHTHWGMPDQACLKSNKQIILNFDLGKVYKVDKFEYIPREDAGNGTFLCIQYKWSIDGTIWSNLSDLIDFEADNLSKTVELNGEALRYFQIFVLDATGGFGSGRQILFYKSIP